MDYRELLARLKAKEEGNEMEPGFPEVPEDTFDLAKTIRDAEPEAPMDPNEVGPGFPEVPEDTFDLAKAVRDAKPDPLASQEANEIGPGFPDAKQESWAKTLSDFQNRTKEYQKQRQASEIAGMRESRKAPLAPNEDPESVALLGLPNVQSPMLPEGELLDELKTAQAATPMKETVKGELLEGEDLRIANEEADIADREEAEEAKTEALKNTIKQQSTIEPPLPQPTQPLSIRDLLDQAAQGRTESVEELKQANKDKNKSLMINNLLSLIGKTSANYAQSRSGLKVDAPDDAAARKMLNSQTEQTHKGKIQEIQAKQDDLQGKVKDIITGKQLDKLDPNSDISNQSRLIFANKVGQERMDKLEQQGIDLGNLSYSEQKELMNTIMDGEMTPKEIALFKNKQTIAGQKAEAAEKNIERANKKEDRKVLRDTHDMLSANKRAKTMRDYKTQAEGVKSILTMLRPYRDDVKNMDESDMLNVSTKISRFLSKSAPTKDLIYDSMAKRFTSQWNSLVNKFDDKNVPASYYTPEMIEHMASTIDDLGKEAFRNLNIAYASTFNRDVTAMKRNPEEMNRFLRMYKGAVEYDEDQDMFVPAGGDFERSIDFLTGKKKEEPKKNTSDSIQMIRVTDGEPVMVPKAVAEKALASGKYRR